MAHHDDDHDDRHDLGLLYDLSMLGVDRSEVRRFGRRRALQVLAGGAGALALAACGRSGSGASSASSSTSTAPTTSSTLSGSASTTAAASGSGDASTVTQEIPDETGGPYPADGTNGPNVLTESGIVRPDLRSSFGSLSGTTSGVPLQLALKVVHAGTGKAYGGAAVYLWHCSADGRYSLYSQGATDQNWLRGVQAADGNGDLAFTTVFPGAYSGRYPHIHFEVFSSLGAATSTGGKLKTSQMALPKAACDAVYATSGYPSSASNLSRTSLSSDMVFSDGYSLQLPTVTGDAGGMTATLTIAV
jgi:protocatechuate 3,4-dioxygenase beta subunit